ncbi:hypothetical protein [Labilibaculum euxinus]
MLSKITNIIALTIIIFLASCTENKKVVDQLDLDEVESLVQQDTLYEEIIIEVESKRKLIENNLVLKSKFKDLSYADYLQYKKNSIDTSLLKNIYFEADSIHKAAYTKHLTTYKAKIDSTISNYKKIKEKYSPENYFNVEFSSIDKEYYSYNNGVRNVTVKFKITPLKGPIQGGSFHYKVIPKVTNKEVADASCRFSLYTSRSTIYEWEAPYDIKDEFENNTTSSIKNNYNIKFTYLTVRKDGKTFSITDLNIPYCYERALNLESLSEYDYEYILKKQFYADIKPSYKLVDELILKKKKLINPIAYNFEMLNTLTKN